MLCDVIDRFRGDLNLVKGALAQVAERTPLLESAVRSARHMADLVNRPSSSMRKKLLLRPFVRSLISKLTLPSVPFLWIAQTSWT